MNHLQAVETLAAERYLLNEMTEGERDAFEDHFFACVECAEDVRLGALMRDGARAGFAGPPQTQPVRPRPLAPSARRAWFRRPSVALPWAMAAMLAMVAGYQALWVVPALRRQTDPQALAPVMLRPASRGSDPVVSLGGRDVVGLAVDASVADLAGDLAYDLRSADGNPIATGRTAAPPAGTPLLLLIPTSRLSPPGRYVLSLRDVTAGDRAIAEYRFAVAP
jgi:hypothetical protein